MSQPQLPSNVRFQTLPSAPGYGVSNDGRIWSQRPINGIGPMTMWRELQPIPNYKGYHRISLRINNQTRNFSVHRLILESFTGTCPPGMEGCHNNNIVTDNNIKNLRWDTRSGNFSDKHANGTAPIGNNHPQARLTEDDVRSIRREAADGRTVTSLMNEYQVTRCHIHGIIKRKVWKHI